MTPTDLTTSLNEPQRKPLYSFTPSGRVALSSAAARTALELFAGSLRTTLGGCVIDISISAHRDERRVRWECHVHGVERSVSITFLESGCTRVPTFAPEVSYAGEVTDSVDAHYLFEFLKRELLKDCSDF